MAKYWPPVSNCSVPMIENRFSVLGPIRGKHSAVAWHPDLFSVRDGLWTVEAKLRSSLWDEREAVKISRECAAKTPERTENWCCDSISHRRGKQEQDMGTG